MHIRVLFFGMLKDITGMSEDRVDVPAGSGLGDVFDRYASRFPRMGEMASSIVLARNQEFAGRDVALADQDEVAFLPPVSGGSDKYLHVIEDPEGHFYALTRQTIDSPEVARQILQGRDGAIITFEGVVRNNTKGRATKFLDYECYEPMAIKVMAQIGREIAAGHSISRIAMVHRLGRMQIGEASVSIIVASPHRRAAFDAALEGINRLKRLVPIWKKEHFEDGEVWVEGEWDSNAPVADSGDRVRG
jgi:molybdopterin synthase catalytic subunit